MLDIILFKLNAGISLGSSKDSSGTTPLSIPWETDQDNQRIFSLLRWRRQLSEFYGRDDELKELREWTDSDKKNVSMKFVIGEGGTGKTRLAAEFARIKGDYDNWATGFIHLNSDANYSFKPNNNVLLLIDYPEQYPETLKHLLRSINKFPKKRKLRILFLSRHPWEKWQETFIDAGIEGIVADDPIYLDKLDPDAALEVYKSTAENALKIFGEDPEIEISEELVRKWLKAAPLNNRALYIVGAALKYALDPNSHDVTYSAAEIIDSLVDRELTRLRNSANSSRLTDEWAFAKLLAMATFAGEISVWTVIKWAKLEKLDLGLDKVKKIRPLLNEAHLTEEYVINAPEPDTVAAWFALKVFDQSSHAAPEMLWNTLVLNLGDNLKRFERIEYDVSRLIYEAGDIASKLIRGSKHFPNWLKSAVEENETRCLRLKDYFNDTHLPQSLLPAAISVYEILSAKSTDEAESAFYSGTIALIYSAIGDNEKALQKIIISSDIYSRLAKINPIEFEPNLADSLNNMSNYLSYSGDNGGALEAIKDAVEIYRRLAVENPAKFEPDLAISLNNISSELSDIGDKDGALKTIEEAIEIYRRLTADNPARFEPDLASSLNNMSIRLSDTGDNEGALEAIIEAVEIYRRLATDTPARFEPNLANSLGGWGKRLLEDDKVEEAIVKYKEAIELVKPHAEQYPNSKADKTYQLAKGLLSDAKAKLSGEEK